MELQEKSKRTAVIALLAVFVVWGLTVPVTKLALLQFPPFILLFLRFSLSALILTPVFLIDDVAHPISWRDLPKLGLLSLLGPALTNVLFYFGIRETTALDASVLSAFFPVVNTALALLILKEKVGVWSWVGSTIALVGSFVVIGEPLLHLGQSGSLVNITGNLFIVASVFTWAAFVIASKKIAHHYSSLTLSALDLVIATLAVAPFAAFEFAHAGQDFLQNINSTGLLSLAFLILGGSVFAYLLLEWAFDKVKAQTSGFLSYIQPAVAIGAAFFILGEKITLPFVAGTFFVLLGVSLIIKFGYLGANPHRA